MKLNIYIQEVGHLTLFMLQLSHVSCIFYEREVISNRNKLTISNSKGFILYHHTHVFNLAAWRCKHVENISLLQIEVSLYIDRIHLSLSLQSSYGQEYCCSSNLIPVNTISKCA